MYREVWAKAMLKITIIRSGRERSLNMLPLSATRTVLKPDATKTDSRIGNGCEIEEIRRRARQIHRERGGFWGYDFDDWSLAWGEISQTRRQSEKELEDENAIGLLLDRENVYTKQVLGRLNRDEKRHSSNIVRCLFSALLLALSTVMAGCERQASSAPAPPAPTVEVAAVIQKNVPVDGEWVGTLQGYVNAQIQPQVTGYLVRQDYQEGSFVHTGQLLFEIDPRPFQAALDQAKGQLAQAEAQMANAEINVKRDIPEADAHAIPQSQLDNDTQMLAAAKATVETDQAAVETAQLNLGYTRIFSLIDGIAGVTAVQVGNLVTQSTVLTSVSQVNPIKVYFPISEREYLRMADGSASGRVDWLTHAAQIPLELTLADGSRYSDRGKIIFADRQVDTNTGTIQIVGEFPNPKNLLRPGQYAQIRALSEVLKGALLVPQAAVNQLQGSYQVVVVAAENKAQIRKVEVGPTIGTSWVITAGLRPGERVVTVGTEKVTDGQVVNPTPYQEGEDQ
jgi:RND family efflux transporter MFP subunit